MTTLVVTRQLICFLLGIVTRQLTLTSVSKKGLWLAVDEVVHHHNVMVGIIIRSWSVVAGYDPDDSDPWIGEHDPEEGEVSITGRGRHSAGEYPLPAAVETLEDGTSVSLSVSSIRLINVCEDRTETGDRGWLGAVGTGDEEKGVRNVAAYWSEQPRRAECSEGLSVIWITEEGFKSQWGGLRKTGTWGCEPGAACIEEHVERVYRRCRIRDCGVAAIPVDLATTARERSWVIAVIDIPQSSAEGVDCALNRGRGWSGSLEDSRCHEGIG